MDDQKTTPDDRKTNGGPSSRRRISIGAALLLMGAVIVDPGLLDDANVSVELNSGTTDEPVDAFEQIELMLSQAEGNKPSIASAPSMPEATVVTTLQDDSPSQRETHTNAESMTLMIPGQTRSPESDQAPSLEIPTEDEIPAPAVKGVSFPGDVIEIHREQPSVATRDNQNAELRDDRVASTIRLLGTIDPHH